MPKAKYESIYKDLKQKIESQEYPCQELLPSENTMVEIYGCSRNTIRRAVAQLVEEATSSPSTEKASGLFTSQWIRLLFI